MRTKFHRAIFSIAELMTIAITVRAQLSDGWRELTTIPSLRLQTSGAFWGNVFFVDGECYGYESGHRILV